MPKVEGLQRKAGWVDMQVQYLVNGAWQDTPGVVAAANFNTLTQQVRVNLSARFMKELIDAMQDNYSKWQTREGIKNLPEVQRREERGEQ